MFESMRPALSEESPVRMTFLLPGRNPGRMDLTIGTQSTWLPVSWRPGGDPLSAILHASWELLSVRGSGPRAAGCRLKQGTGAWVLDLWGHRGRLHVLVHWDADNRDENLQTVLDATCTIRDFAWAVGGEAARLNREYGVEGYRARTGGQPFPTDAFAALECALVSTHARPFARARLRSNAGGRVAPGLNGESSVALPRIAKSHAAR